MTTERKKRNRKLLAIGAGVAIVAGAYFAKELNDALSADTAVDGRVHQQLVLQRDAFNICKQFVTERLRAPRSEQFATFDEAVVTRLNDDDYERRPFAVKAFVDAQNGFGALLRQDFVCTVKPTNQGGRWELIDMQMRSR